MSGRLCQLMGVSSNRRVATLIAEIEKVLGDKTIDAKLIGDCLVGAHEVCRTLRLDIRHLEPRELYHALRSADQSLLAKLPRYTGLLVQGEVISFHPKDLRKDENEQAKFNERTLRWMQDVLRQEVVRRYKYAADGNAALLRRVNELRDELAN
jgi:hypothetical protein